MVHVTYILVWQWTVCSEELSCESTGRLTKSPSGQWWHWGGPLGEVLSTARLRLWMSDTTTNKARPIPSVQRHIACTATQNPKSENQNPESLTTKSKSATESAVIFLSYICFFSPSVLKPSLFSNRLSQLRFFLFMAAILKWLSGSRQSTGGEAGHRQEANIDSALYVNIRLPLINAVLPV